MTEKIIKCAGVTLRESTRSHLASISTAQSRGGGYPCAQIGATLSKGSKRTMSRKSQNERATLELFGAKCIQE